MSLIYSSEASHYRLWPFSSENAASSVLQSSCSSSSSHPFGISAPHTQEPCSKPFLPCLIRFGQTARTEDESCCDASQNHCYEKPFLKDDDGEGWGCEALWQDNFEGKKDLKDLKDLQPNAKKLLEFEPIVGSPPLTNIAAPGAGVEAWNEISCQSTGKRIWKKESRCFESPSKGKSAEFHERFFVGTVQGYVQECAKELAWREEKKESEIRDENVISQGNNNRMESRSGPDEHNSRSTKQSPGLDSVGSWSSLSDSSLEEHLAQNFVDWQPVDVMQRERCADVDFTVRGEKRTEIAEEKKEEMVGRWRRYELESRTREDGGVLAEGESSSKEQEKGKEKLEGEKDMVNGNRGRLKVIKREIKEAREYYKVFGVWVRKNWGGEEEEEVRLWEEAERRVREKERKGCWKGEEGDAICATIEELKTKTKEGETGKMEEESEKEKEKEGMLRLRIEREEAKQKEKEWKEAMSDMERYELSLRKDYEKKSRIDCTKDSDCRSSLRECHVLSLPTEDSTPCEKGNATASSSDLCRISPALPSGHWQDAAVIAQAVLNSSSCSPAPFIPFAPEPAPPFANLLGPRLCSFRNQHLINQKYSSNLTIASPRAAFGPSPYFNSANDPSFKSFVLSSLPRLKCSGDDIFCRNSFNPCCIENPPFPVQKEGASEVFSAMSNTCSDDNINDSKASVKHLSSDVSIENHCITTSFISFAFFKSKVRANLLKAELRGLHDKGKLIMRARLLSQTPPQMRFLWSFDEPPENVKKEWKRWFYLKGRFKGKYSKKQLEAIFLEKKSKENRNCEEKPT
ncbi:uncharacterized protein MONOS_15621 [Monocercomonoides exilis]|uniref:uncharacterized protein n=1 Tax=Monocercomonoides exilis TaxID=2049356 RepID=UPI00355A0428|nr:hypothetical protein MONOS_15621 [Monocercomonoides exilis]